MTMSSQFGANTLEVTRALEGALDDLKPVFENNGIKLYPALHRPATFIETALANMKHSLALGGILVGVVLFIMLGSTRTAFISLTAIPLSLLTAVIILERFGITLMLPLPAKPGVNVAAAQFAASAIFWSVAPLQVVLRIP